MALAVPSTANTGYTASGSVTIAKPASLAVGELLLAVLTADDSTDSTINTLSGWTLVQSQTYSSADNSVNVQYKVADAGDVAASDFTFTTTAGTSRIGGAILRITGNTPTSCVEVILTNFNDTADSATVSVSGSATPTFDGSLLVMVLAGTLTGAGTGTVGTYVINGSNPTWTEVLDTSVDSGTRDPISGAAYATLDTTREITSFGATLSAVRADHGAILVAVKPLLNVTVTPDPITLSGSIQAPVIAGGANISPATVTLSSTLNSPTVATPAHDWVADDKSGATSFSNTEKS